MFRMLRDFIAPIDSVHRLCEIAGLRYAAGQTTIGDTAVYNAALEIQRIHTRYWWGEFL